MNKFIKGTIIPNQIHKKVLNSNVLDISYTRFDESIEAVVKYFRLKKKSSLNLQGCNMNDKMVFDLVGHLLNMN